MENVTLLMCTPPYRHTALYVRMMILIFTGGPGSDLWVQMSVCLSCEKKLFHDTKLSRNKLYFVVAEITQVIVRLNALGPLCLWQCFDVIIQFNYSKVN